MGVVVKVVLDVLAGGGGGGGIPVTFCSLLLSENPKRLHLGLFYPMKNMAVTNILSNMLKSSCLLFNISYFYLQKYYVGVGSYAENKASKEARFLSK